jgi:hypothetical protein
LIKGVEVEVEAEEVAEDVGVGQKNYEEPGPCGSAADFLLGEEMEGDPSGREEVQRAGLHSLASPNALITPLFTRSHLIQYGQHPKQALCCGGRSSCCCC